MQSTQYLLPLSQCLQDGSSEAQRQHAQSAPPEAQQQPAQQQQSAQQQQPPAPRGEGDSPTASADEEGADPRQQAQVHVPGQVHVTLKVRAGLMTNLLYCTHVPPLNFGQQQSGGDGLLRMLCCVRSAAHAGFCPIFWYLLGTCQSCKPLCKCRGIQNRPDSMIGCTSPTLRSYPLFYPLLLLCPGGGPALVVAHAQPRSGGDGGLLELRGPRRLCAAGVGLRAAWLGVNADVRRDVRRTAPARGTLRPRGAAATGGFWHACGDLWCYEGLSLTTLAMAGC